MAEATNKNQSNPGAEEADKATKTTRVHKARKPAKIVGPNLAPQLANLLEGFTPEEVASLVKTKEAVEQGRYSDLTDEHRKLLFVKWLVEHEKLTS
jgi:hypothetical protein